MSKFIFMNGGVEPIKEPPDVITQDWGIGMLPRRDIKSIIIGNDSLHFEMQSHGLTAIVKVARPITRGDVILIVYNDITCDHFFASEVTQGTALLRKM